MPIKQNKVENKPSKKFVRHFKLVVQVDWVLGLNLTSVNLLQVLQLADVWKSTAKYKN